MYWNQVKPKAEETLEGWIVTLDVLKYPCAVWNDNGSIPLNSNIRCIEIYQNTGPTILAGVE